VKGGGWQRRRREWLTCGVQLIDAEVHEVEGDDLEREVDEGLL
jgi:hypothetical protein